MIFIAALVFSLRQAGPTAPINSAYFFVTYLIGLIYFGTALYVFITQRNDPAGRAFSVFCASVGIALATIFEAYTSHRLSGAWIVSMAIAGGALFHFAAIFPAEVSLVGQRPYLAWTGYAVGTFLALSATAALVNHTDPTIAPSAWRLIFFFGASTFVGFLLLNLLRLRSAISPGVREQARVMLIGALAAALPPLAGWATSSLLPAAHFSPLYLLSMGVFPPVAANALLRHRSLRADALLSRGLMYALLAGAVMVAYALFVGGLSLLFGDFLARSGINFAANPLVVGLMVILLALGLNPARNALQAAVDRSLFRNRSAYRDLEQAFGQELTRLMDQPAVLEVLRRTVDQALAPTALHIFIFDPLKALFSTSPVADVSQNAPLTSDLWFQATGPLAENLADSNETLFLPDPANPPASLLLDAPRLKLLAAVVYIPLPGRRRLTGWLALGARRSGAAYTASDLAFLEAVANQAALAVERAQVVSDLERRVREMNVLTRVAQGVSFTLAFDDILELISAQTNQIVPARDLRITLLDESTGVLSHAFFLEDDERVEASERRPLPAGRGLEREVIQGRRAILTDDYERECRSRGVLSNAPGVHAWMGVPLNAGAQTIGSMTIGSRDLRLVYTEEQRDLLQAIADQASGAIVKARALEESERRALQLKRLNEIGLGVTSTLDLKPLLNQILTSATEILECQAGSLFLVDTQTDELVFEVVLGPVAVNLAGRRLPKGAGLVGQAVQTGRAIIANDAKRRKEWFEKPDEQTGFDTQDLLVVPMRIHDRVIGVIEVINKASGAPFTTADQELLTAFTSQATIAIENARLYTMTDQALAARVEELSVMQRIDRELNAGLDIERAMRLTLDWAMRWSRADAGLVGTVDDEKLRVVVAQGYSQDGDGFNPADEQALNLIERIGPMKDAIEKGLPGHCVLDPPVGREADRLLVSARRQIVVPIRRETHTIGVLLLESARPEALPDELMSFLTRLSDHAAIAIANARLFEEVKEANLAKSRFVSFVAHELKNPMASIKGYTELVSSGMAGPVNEMQGSFLQTVKSNVDRMNTIVSDLNDLTKIETGNLALDFRSVRVTEVLDDVVRSIQRQVDEKKQALNLHAPADLPAVWGDPARLTQVLTNLVSNAHKYTPEGKAITIGAENAVEAISSGPAAMVHVWVTDEGIGISEEDQKKIFQQYFRTDNAKEMASGTGLGLAITRSFIELQGGRIWFESQLGVGTTFHLVVPAAEGE